MGTQVSSPSQTPDSPFHQWAAAYRRFQQEGTDLLWPSETLVRLFKGNYIPGHDPNVRGKRVLDVGFGCGNNTVFLASLGMEVCGAEVDPDICAQVERKLRTLGHTADLRVGTNRELPFPDNHFAYLVSWNVLHYENCEDDIRAALREYTRVLAPGGRLILSTTGPEHKILQDGETLGGHRYRIGRQDDFRRGQVYFYFDAPNYLEHYLGEVLAEVHVGRTHDRLFTETLDWFLATAVKPPTGQD